MAAGGGAFCRRYAVGLRGAMCAMRWLMVAAAWTLTMTAPTAAELSPSQVLIVANTRSSESLPLARYYASVREIPSDHILALDLPVSEEMSRADYDARLATPIRQFLTQGKLTDPIALIVCVYGVPLKVAAKPVDASRQRLAQTLARQFRRTFRQLTDLHGRLATLAALPSTDPEATLTGVTGQPVDFIQQRSHIDPALAKLAVRVEKRLATLPKDQHATFAGEFGQIVLELRGVTAMPAQTLQKEMIEQIVSAQRVVAEQAMLDPAARGDLAQYYEAVKTLGGVLSLLQAVYDDISKLEYRLSSAAVDDELSLVRYDDVPLAGRLPNALNPRLASHPICQKWPDVLMTGRIDGPTAKIARRMIDDALAAEQSGLMGRAVIDARGITDKTSGYRAYDADLRTLAAALTSSSKLKTIFDNREPVLSGGAARDVALYCGWYSVKKYVSACRFARGAVAWHIASFEAMTLRLPSPV